MPSLIGNKPNQVPSNGDLGTLAFQDSNAVKVTGGDISGNISTSGLNIDSNTFVIDATNDRVGIGTASPTVKLDVVASAGTRQTQSAFTSLIVQRNATEDLTAGINIIGGATTGQSRIDFSDSGANAVGALIYSHDSNYLRFDANSAERMRLDSSGNLGLGVTPSAWASTFKAIQVGAGGSIYGRTGSTVSEVNVGSNAYFDTTDNRFEYIGTGLSALYQQNDGTHRFYNAISGTAGNAITFTQAMTLDASGNLGIGVTSVGNRLHVKPASGNVVARFEGATSGQSAYIFAGSGTQGISNSDGTYGWFVDIAATNVKALTNNTERMRIDSSGNLLVGITSARANAGDVQVSKGISFPATQSAQSDANTLDDYEEGTFTPTIVGTTTAGTGTYSVEVGRYTKIGNRVYFNVNLAWSAHTGTGNMRISGLPFTSNNTTNNLSATSTRFNDIALTAGNVIQTYIASNSSQVILEQIPTGGGSNGAVPIDTSAGIVVSGHYEV